MSKIKSILFGGSSLSPAPEFGLTLLRLFTGLMLALAHGRTKLPPPEKFVEMVGKMGFPAPTAAAWISALTEFLGGILLAIGLCTRPAAFFIAFNMAVAAFAVNGGGFDKMELPLFYFFVALAFLFVGGGRFSIDRAIRKTP